MKTAIIGCLLGLMGISGFTSVLAQETADQEQTITGHEIVENWSGSEDFHLVRFATSQPVPGGQFEAFLPKDLIDGHVTAVSLFWHDDDPNGEYTLDTVLNQALLVTKGNGYPVVPSRPHGSSYSAKRTKDDFDLQKAFVLYLSSIGVDKFNFYAHGGGGQIALILAGELPHLVWSIGLSSPYELCPYDYDHSPLERIAELPDVPILIVHDRPDDSARLRDTYEYVLAVEGAGRQIQLVVEGATTDDSPHHGAMALLGRELHKHLPIRKRDRIVSDGSVNAELLAEMRHDMDLSRDYAKKHLSIASPPSDVFIGSDPGWLTDRYLEAFQLPEGFRQGKMLSFSNCGGGEGGFTAMFIPTCNEEMLTTTRESRANRNAHEWWHVNVQYHLVNTFCCTSNTEIPVYGPEWMAEGAAQVWASLVSNNFTDDLLEQEKTWRLQQAPADFDLLTLNTRQGWQAAPAGKSVVRYLAVWMLVDIAGLSSFEKFYRRLGEYVADEAAREVLDINGEQTALVRDFKNRFFETPQRQQKLDEIFQASFGQTMEQFATSFNEYLNQEEVPPDQERVSQNSP